MLDTEMAQELRAQPGMLPNALVQHGPTLSAAAWQAQVLSNLYLALVVQTPMRAAEQREQGLEQCSYRAYVPNIHKL